MEEKVFAFLKENPLKLCVIATVTSENKPQSAVVGYVVKDNQTLLISTNKTTRKCLNIKANPHVALVFGFSFSAPNIQIEGDARIIDAGDEYKETDAYFFTQNPNAAQFKTPDTVFISIKPTWIRLLDHTAKPGTVEEKIISS